MSEAAVAIKLLKKTYPDIESDESDPESDKLEAYIQPISDAVIPLLFSLKRITSHKTEEYTVKVLKEWGLPAPEPGNLFGKNEFIIFLNLFKV